MTPHSDGLHEIANTEKTDRQADIVFIHGLGGASHSTWRHGKEGKPGHFFWPEDLGKDLPNCGIWSVGYPAGFTELGKPGMIIDRRLGEIDSEMHTIEQLTVDPEHVAAALAEFSELWDVLYPQERTRIVHLLVERVVYDGDQGGIQLVFHPEIFGKLATGPGSHST